MKFKLGAGESNVFPLEGFEIYYKDGTAPCQVTIYDKYGPEQPVILEAGQGLRGRDRFEKVELKNISLQEEVFDIEVRRRSFIDNRTDNKLTVTTESGEPLEVTLAGGGAGGALEGQGWTWQAFHYAGDTEVVRTLYNPPTSPKNLVIDELRVQMTRTVIPNTETFTRNRSIVMQVHNRQQPTPSPSVGGSVFSAYPKAFDPANFVSYYFETSQDDATYSGPKMQGEIISHDLVPIPGGEFAVADNFQWRQPVVIPSALVLPPGYSFMFKCGADEEYFAEVDFREVAPA